MRRIVMVWDIDDVLNSLMRDFLLWYNKRQGAEIAYPDITENPPHRILGCSKEEYLSALDIFRRDFFMELRPNPLAMDWFGSMGCDSDIAHIACTSVPIRFANISWAWLCKHYPFFRVFSFAPSFRQGDDLGPIRSKADALSLFKEVNLFIDDNEQNVSEAGEFCKALLYPAPWNRNRDMMEGDFWARLSSLVAELRKELQ